MLIDRKVLYNLFGSRSLFKGVKSYVKIAQGFVDGCRVSSDLKAQFS